MRTMGVEVNRPFVPVSIQLSEDKTVLDDVHAYPVKESHFIFSLQCILNNIAQVVLKRVDCNDDSETEVVYAKFVIGADGE